MSFTQIGYKGANQIVPRLDVSQPLGGPQTIVRFPVSKPIPLQAGQTFTLPPGQWLVNAGRYSFLQWYDTNALRWRNFSTQPGQQQAVSSDGQNFRIANVTGTPIGAVISTVGNGNATNGYNTVSVTVSAGNSTWGTLVGGSVNTTVTVSAGGNFSLAPHIMWQPAANQTYPYLEPTFTCNLNANGTINAVTCVYGGAGLTATGTLTAVNQAGDNNPGNAVLAMNATLTNSGNLTAMWPLTPGTGLTAVPTFTFNIGGTMCANAICAFTVSNFTVTACGFNMGNKQPFTVISANGVANVTQNAALTGADYGLGLLMPRSCWLFGLTDANSNISTNGNLTVQDAGLAQNVPFLTVIPQNCNGTFGNAPAILAAQVAGITDTSYIQDV